MEKYSVKKIAKLAGISVRTLHHYDEINLLKPSSRNDAGYRFYGEMELYQLQQILFYKELGFELKEIKRLMDSPDFDLIEALKSHKKELQNRRKRISTLLSTIDKTIANLKEGDKMKHEDLYKGLSKEQAKAYRNEAISKWGDSVEKSEKSLMKMGKANFQKLQQDFSELLRQLSIMIDEDPKSTIVQEKIAQHYTMIKKFWGIPDYQEIPKERYIGLGELYVNDDRYNQIDGKVVPGFGEFKRDAMIYFADKNISQ